MESKDKNLELLNAELSDLFGTYNKYKNTQNDKDKKDIKQLYLLRAGKSVESLVEYLIQKENITVPPKNKEFKNDPNYKPTLDDCLSHLGKIKLVTSEVLDDLYNIKNKRNPNVHRNKTEKVEKINEVRNSTVDGVNDSFVEVVNWFFDVYLEGKYADFSKNIYTNQKIVNEPTSEELDEIKKNFEKNPLNIPDFSILKQSKQYKNIVKRKKRRAIFLLIIIFSGLAYLSYYFIFENSNNNIKAQSVNKIHMNEDQVHDFLLKYFDSSNDLNTDAHEFFANKVDTFYFRYNVNPTQIDIIRRENIDYLDNKNSIDKVSLYAYSKNDSITRWRFWTDYTCYRPSKRKFQNCKVQLEFGINTSNKITSIKQVKVGPIHYTKTKPL